MSSDPTTGWLTYSIATDVGVFFFDYPEAGVGVEALYIGSNQFFDGDNDGDLEYQESRLFAIDKVGLYTPAVPAVNWFARKVKHAVNYVAGQNPDEAEENAHSKKK